MKKMSTLEIGKMLGADVIGNTFVKGISVDSRHVLKDDLFVCLVGERVDGHDYAQNAIDKGATALLVDRQLDLNISQILVPDTLLGMFEFAKTYRNMLNIEAIAITGSNGKTSTKDILHSVLVNIAPTIATFENQNTEIGSCLTLFRMDETTKYGIFEMGLDLPGEIEKMLKLVKPTSAILTSLDQAHMDNFNDDIEVLAQEKFSIFETIEDKRRCFYQGDVSWFKDYATDHRSFGFKQDNEFVVHDVDIHGDKMDFRVNDRHYETNLLGTHQASNAAGAIALLRHLGVNDDVINHGLQNVMLTSMRTEIYTYKNATILFDAYKASPKSMEAALNLFEKYTSDAYRVIVLADMYQLGVGTEIHHHNVLNQAISQNTDKIFLLGEEFGRAHQNIEDERIIHFKTFEALKEAIQPYFETDTFILMKGSRYYELERLLEGE